MDGIQPQCGVEHDVSRGEQRRTIEPVGDLLGALDPLAIVRVGRGVGDRGAEDGLDRLGGLREEVVFLSFDVATVTLDPGAELTEFAPLLSFVLAPCVDGRVSPCEGWVESTNSIGVQGHQGEHEMQGGHSTK